jgi:hypothetical protein
MALPLVGVHLRLDSQIQQKSYIGIVACPSPTLSPPRCTVAMVKHLIPLITPKRSPERCAASPTSPEHVREHQSRSVRGSISRIGSLLSQSFHNSLQLTNIRALSNTATPCTPTSTAACSSPVRARKNHQPTQSFGPSPRSGDKSKIRGVDGIISHDVQTASTNNTTTTIQNDVKSWELY